MNSTMKLLGSWGLNVRPDVPFADGQAEEVGHLVRHLERSDFGAEDVREIFELEVAGHDLRPRQNPPLKVIEEEVTFASLASGEHASAIGSIHTETDRAEHLEQHRLRLLSGFRIGQAVGEHVGREAREFVLGERTHRRRRRLSGQSGIRADRDRLKLGLLNAGAS